MTTEIKAPACPACGSAAHIYARIDVKWIPEARSWAVLQPDSWDRFECTDCDAEFTAEGVGLPDPVAGLGYASAPTADAPPPTGEAMAHALQVIAANAGAMANDSSASHRGAWHTVQRIAEKASAAAIGGEG